MELDPGAKGRISVTLVPELIKKLSPPLGLKREHITEPMLIKVRRGRAAAREEEGEVRAGNQRLAYPGLRGARAVLRRVRSVRETSPVGGRLGGGRRDGPPAGR